MGAKTSTGNVLTVTDSAGVRGGSAFTVACLIKPLSLPGSGNLYCVVDKYNNAGGYLSGFDLRYYNDGTQKIGWFVFHGTTSTGLDTAHSMSAGDWHWLTATYDTAGYLDLWQDTTRLIHIAAGAAPWTSATALYLGEFSLAVFPFDGIIADVRHYTRVLSPYEIAILATSAGADHITDGLTMHHQFMGQTGATIAGSQTELSGHGNSASPTGYPTFAAAPIRRIK